MCALPAPQQQLAIVIDESQSLADQPGVLGAVRELLLIGRKPGIRLDDRAPNGLPRFWQYPTVEQYTTAWTPKTSAPPTARDAVCLPPAAADGQ